MRCHSVLFLLGLFWPLLPLANGSAPPAEVALETQGGTDGKQPPGDFLPGVRRILFLGDSITYDGRYSAAFETEWLLHLKERPIEIINCGLPSETVSGLSEEGHAGGKFPRPDLHERLERVLQKTTPGLVFACYGMNDGIYLPLSAERFGKFKDGMTRLHKQVEAAGARIIHLTPPVFDALPIQKRVAPADQVSANRPFEGYDQVLARYTAWLLEMRDQQGWQVIDLHGPMKAALARARETNAKFTFAPDGVHPNPAGQLLLARALIQGLKAPFDSAVTAFGDSNDPASQRGKLWRLVQQRQRLLTDAWLTDIGHKRPMTPGLPLEKAKAQAKELDRELRALLTGSPAVGGAKPKTRILFIGKNPDHPHGTHMYMHTCGMLAKCLELTPGVEAVVSNGWPKDPATLQGVKAIVVYTNPAAELLLEGEQRGAVHELMKQGVGLVTIHWASSVNKGNLERLGPTWLSYMGGTWVSNVGLSGGKSTLKQLAPEHPICRGWKEYEIEDEYYLDPVIDKKATPVLQVRERKGKDVIVGWAFERPGGGRAFGTTLGHFYKNFQDDGFRRMVVNSILWAAQVDVPQGGAPVNISAAALALPPKE